MLADAPNADTLNRPVDWQVRLHAVLGNCFPQLAKALTGAPDATELQFELVKSSPQGLCLKLSSGGRCGFLKLFDGGDAAGSYHREKTALQSMLNSGLVPGIHAYSDGLGFVLTDWIVQPLELSKDPEQAAFFIGAWLAQFEALAPAKPAQGNWYSYLSKIGSGLDLGQISTARKVLSEIPLCGQVLARNDAALHNYLMAPNGGVLGCDFEQARMRPRGWDYMLGFAALIERFPNQSNKVLKAYSNGFSKSHRGGLIMDELNAVARILYCAGAIASCPDQEVPSWQ